MRKITGSNIEVTKQDQSNINLFSKLYSKTQDMQSLLSNVSEKISHHKDTLDEMIMNQDEEEVRYRFGTCFFTITTESARELVEKDIKKLEAEKTNLDKQLDSMKKKMKKLKASLYGKFGNSINLEE